MWKDFFYYSKSERRAILFLLGIGILLLVYGSWKRSETALVLTEVDSIRVDSFLIKTVQKKTYKDSFSHARMSRQRVVRPVILADFDPNTADSAMFCRLGLPPFLAKRIISYRAKGGVFRKADDFARIYGLSAEQFKVLSPYIHIDDSFQLHSKRRDTLR